MAGIKWPVIAAQEAGVSTVVWTFVARVASRLALKAMNLKISQGFLVKMAATLASAYLHLILIVAIK